MTMITTMRTADLHFQTFHPIHQDYRRCRPQYL